MYEIKDSPPTVIVKLFWFVVIGGTPERVATGGTGEAILNSP
jgi:hypothetical protein